MKIEKRIVQMPEKLPSLACIHTESNVLVHPSATALSASFHKCASLANAFSRHTGKFSWCAICGIPLLCGY